jgi:hypothetical protein
MDAQPIAFDPHARVLAPYLPSRASCWHQQELEHEYVILNSDSQHVPITRLPGGTVVPSTRQERPGARVTCIASN